MKVILLENMIIEGRRYRAGEAVEMDAEQADALQFMDLIYIEPSATLEPENTEPDGAVMAENEEVRANTQPSPKTAPKKGRKAASK